MFGRGIAVPVETGAAKNPPAKGAVVLAPAGIVGEDEGMFGRGWTAEADLAT